MFDCVKSIISSAQGFCCLLDSSPVGKQESSFIIRKHLLSVETLRGLKHDCGESFLSDRKDVLHLNSWFFTSSCWFCPSLEVWDPEGVGSWWCWMLSTGNLGKQHLLLLSVSARKHRGINREFCPFWGRIFKGLAKIYHPVLWLRSTKF